MTARSYTYAGQTFSTKGALLRYFSAAIDRRVRGDSRSFFDAVLADCFADRSYRFKGQRPTAFAYLPQMKDDPRAFTHGLAAYLPNLGWRRFSARGLLNEVVSFDTRFPALCRERFATIWRPRLFVPGSCATVGCTLPAADLDHVCPSHKAIVAACAALVTDELRAAWAVWVGDMEDRRHFVLPSDQPATIEYDRLTAAAAYQRLCKPHHRKTLGAGRGQSVTPNIEPVV